MFSAPPPQLRLAFDRFISRGSAAALALAALLLAPPGAIAQDDFFDVETGDIETLRHAAAGGDPEAQHRLDLLRLDSFDLPADLAADYARLHASRSPRAADASTTTASPAALPNLPAGLVNSPDLTIGRSTSNGLLLAPPGAVGQDENETIDVETLRRAVAMGDPEAQYQLGWLHLNGFGVDLDPAETVRLHRLAAAQGHRLAHYSLRNRYFSGQGVPHDAAEAVRWIRTLAERGDAGAQSSLAFYYNIGYGVEQSGAEAIRWRRMAAEQNSSSRGYKYFLGLRYFWGEGIAQDHAEAVRWFEKAAALYEGAFPYSSAERLLALMHRMGFGVEQDHSQAEYWYCRSASFARYEECGADNQPLHERRIQWAQSSATQSRAADAREGDPGDLYYFVQQYFLYGYIWGYDTLPNQILPQSLYGAIVVHPEWSGEQPDVRLLALAEAGNPDAQYYVGEMHYYGYGVPQSHAEAARWYRSAAEQGHVNAHSRLSTAYFYGRGVPQDLVESVRWLRLLADEGNAGAQYSLALRYRWGRGVPRDAGEYVRLLSLAAEQEYRSAYGHLGDLYLRGEGVLQDDAAAAEWYRRYGSTSSSSLNTAERRLLSMHYYGKIAQDETVANVGSKLVESPWLGFYRLGLLHYHGKGVAQDLDEAVLQLQRAAFSGSGLGSDDYKLSRSVLAVLSERDEAPPAIIGNGDSSYVRFNLDRPLTDSSVLLADLYSRTVRVTPNALATAFGAGFAGLGARAVGALDESGRLSTQAGGVCLEVNGVRAPLLFVSDRQINFQVPAETVAAADATVAAIAGCGTERERRSAPVSVTTHAHRPRFFLLEGFATIIAVHGASGALVADGGSIPGASPAKPGEVVVLYGTGFGAVSPAPASGELAQEARRLTANVSAGLYRTGSWSQWTARGDTPPYPYRDIYYGNVYWEQNTTIYRQAIGGDVDVLYAGAAPGFAGLYQMNVRIPENAPAGVLGLRFVIDDDGDESTYEPAANGFIVVGEE